MCMYYLLRNYMHILIHNGQCSNIKNKLWKTSITNGEREVLNHFSTMKQWKPMLWTWLLLEASGPEKETPPLLGPWDQLCSSSSFWNELFNHLSPHFEDQGSFISVCPVLGAILIMEWTLHRRFWKYTHMKHWHYCYNNCDRNSKT